MKAQGQWIISILLFGAMIESAITSLDKYITGNENTSTVLTWVLFLFMIWIGPTWRELEDYWREKYGK